MTHFAREYCAIPYVRGWLPTVLNAARALGNVAERTRPRRVTNHIGRGDGYHWRGSVGCDLLKFLPPLLSGYYFTRSYFTPCVVVLIQFIFPRLVVPSAGPFVPSFTSTSSIT